MRTLSALAVSLAIVAAPNLAAASSPIPAATDTAGQPAALTQDDIYISRDNLVAIGVGALGGYVVLGTLLGVPHGLAAVIGGVAGHWWYGKYEAERSMTPLQYRVPSSFAMNYPAASPLVQARWLNDAPQND